ncbi:MAG: efflux RND transporter periplasmic adaptor subunit [Planctomycetota bacterium]|nr:efflux RND transporter periplasmic adaptor subunit [Planctomycetota bacterium]
MRTLIQTVACLAVVSIGSYFGWLLLSNPVEPPRQEKIAHGQAVRVTEVMPGNVQLKVHTSGTVTPRTEIRLIPEISGRIVWISPSLAAGGFFDEGELLVKLDLRDYELALIQTKAEVARAQLALTSEEQVSLRQAEAEVARAQLALAREEAEAEQARKDWEKLGTGKGSPLALHEPQVAEARATVAAARALLALHLPRIAEAKAAVAAAQAHQSKAELDLQRTELNAPFAGRARRKNVDLGQFINRGEPIATIYAVDFAEIRLPIPDEELAFLDLPLDYRGDSADAALSQQGPQTTLSTIFAGRRWEWSAQIVRVEGELDPQSRVVQAVARVANPYNRSDTSGRPPLAVGMFVEATITGRTIANATKIPRAALRPDGRVVMIDTENRVRLREVKVLRKLRTQALVTEGLKAGETICLSAPETVTEGTVVRPIRDDSREGDKR